MCIRDSAYVRTLKLDFVVFGGGQCRGPNRVAVVLRTSARMKHNEMAISDGFLDSRYEPTSKELIPIYYLYNTICYRLYMISILQIERMRRSFRENVGCTQKDRLFVQN